MKLHKLKALSAIKSIDTIADLARRIQELAINAAADPENYDTDLRKLNGAARRNSTSL